ncbi:MAG: DNA-processing protein DprA [Candidatus Melainabacteria bacterium]|nr:DNA-processing protein DprA [Candidatus Melainabacteria bacterium]
MTDNFLESLGDSPGDVYDEEETAYWVAFDKLSGTGLGIARLKMLYERFGSLKEVWHLPASELSEIRGLTKEQLKAFEDQRRIVNPEVFMAELFQKGVTALPYCHPLYPYLLRDIADAPLVLYMKGKLTPRDFAHCVAIVGTRTPTSYGQKHAKEISKNLSLQGATIVSGMALGVDSYAHWGAIENNAKTIAVLGCGIDICYPSSNKNLYKKLAEEGSGAVISEFYPGTKPEKWMFPARNRIVSGLSQATIVIEAGLNSGALITCELAFEQNRHTFALPGRIDNDMSRGCHKLIANTKARILTDWKDILNDLSWISKSSPIANEIATIIELFGREKDVFELLSREPIHFDVLAQQTGMGGGELSATLTMLEIAGLVNRHPGDWFSKVD